MRYLLDSQQMKMVDAYSIQEVGIPSVVLMERAALSVADVISEQFLSTTKTVVVCGSGNNGADGVALARILSERGYPVTIYSVGESQGTTEYRMQMTIAHKEGIDIRNNVRFDEYNLIVDAIFGIGLSRDISGHYCDVVNEMNRAEAKVVAVDIPSGIHGTTGQILNCAVRAHCTVTFGYEKIGLVLYPGAEYAGKVLIKDVGFSRNGLEKIAPSICTFTQDDLRKLPKRPCDSNKGTFGKVLIIAGSKDMGGAASLSALAAYRAGGGLVRVLTHSQNRNVIITSVPETVLTTYDENTSQEQLEDIVMESIEWATFVVAGPGLSQCEQARIMTRLLVKKCTCPVLFDADALNIIAEEKLSIESEQVIVTPHIGEMSRLISKSIMEIKDKPIEAAVKFAEDNGVVCVLKDARTVVASPDGRAYVNQSGNCGMATAGAGDVLTGIIAGMSAELLQAEPILETAAMGVFVHGLAGDKAAQRLGQRGMKAGDIAEDVALVLADD